MEIIADLTKLEHDTAARILLQGLNDLNLENALLFYNFPFYRGETRNDLIQAHMLFLSPKYGIIFFRCLNNSAELTEIERDKIDDLDSHIYARINKVDTLRISRRELKVNVTPKFFLANNNQQNAEFPDYVFPQTLSHCLEANKKQELSNEEFEILCSAIEGSVHLKSKKDRLVQDGDSKTKGAILNIIQSQHSVFDIEQKRAALNIIDSPQRIRGLAGSGKTIILTMKAALFHLQNPEATIVYTYFTKALYGQIKYLIEKYYRDFSDNQEPDWTKIKILHGWGGYALKGVYSDICSIHSISPISFLEAKAGEPGNPFNFIFKTLKNHKLKQVYDLTLIDEGQDFPPSFYQVCRMVTKSQRIVWAYDDFQNIFDITIQNEKETFGYDNNNVPYVDFSRNENQLQDIVLKKCYRNPRIILINAFALGLGIYNDKVLQRLENNNHWNDLGFLVEEGNSADNSEMVISRPLENSPIVSNEYFRDDSIQIHIFNNVSDEVNFVCKAILTDIKEQNLRPDDISVISLDGKHIANYFILIERQLNSFGIKCFNILNASTSNTRYNIEDHVTLSTLNKAKGNESGMVYIVGTEYGFKHKDYIIDRNKIFTAITRSKGWVVLTGFEGARQCAIEMDRLKGNDYKLKFTQPSEKQTRTILRGITKQQELLNTINNKIQDLEKSGLSRDQILAMLQRDDTTKK